MKDYFREPVIKKEENYPKVIMPEEKDKIVNELINQKTNGFLFEYKDVPNLNISKVQFEKVMIELENMGMIKIGGYKNSGRIYPTSKLDTFYRYGGFKMQDQILSNDLERLKLELENLKKTMDPSISEEITGKLESSLKLQHLLHLHWLSFSGGYNPKCFSRCATGDSFSLSLSKQWREVYITSPSLAFLMILSTLKASPPVNLREMVIV